MEKELLYAGRYLNLLKAGRWEYVERNNCSGIVVILPVTAAGAVVLVEQERIPVASRVIAFPAGLAGDEADPGESLSLAAGRELEEETGYRAGKLELLLSGPSSPGLCSEVLTFYRATNLTRVGRGGGDASESIVVHEVPLDSCNAWLADKAETAGLMVDVKVFSGLYLLRQWN